MGVPAQETRFCQRVQEEESKKQGSNEMDPPKMEENEGATLEKAVTNDDGTKAESEKKRRRHVSS
jgi:hypothetical protein